MQLKGNKLEGIFIQRINRFEAIIETEYEKLTVHVPNTGRMKEYLIPGCKVILQDSDNPVRKHRYSLLHVYKNDKLVCVNSMYANRIFEEAYEKGRINWLKGTLRREVTFGNSRIDFFAEGDLSTFIEIKSCTFESEGICMFPDAPTERGRKHVLELIKAVHNGYNTAIVIISMMDFTTAFTPYYDIDPLFGEVLKRAWLEGVSVKAYNCSLNADNIELRDEIEVFFR